MCPSRAFVSACNRREMRVRLGRDEGEVVAVLREADAAVPLPGALDAPTAAWWAAHGLPDLVAALVLRPDPTPTYKAAALPLLYTLLAGVVDDLRHARLPLTAACTAFTRALSHTAPFYTRSKDDVTPEFKTRLVREGESERLFARLPRSGRLRECSLLLIGTINYFGDIGGFEALADVIETPTVTVQDMLIALRPVHALRSLFTERFLRLYVGRVRVPIFRALASVAHGDVTSETLAQCSELRASFVRLLARVSLPDAARAACDLDIEVAARLLQGDSLQRRLNGLQRLREVISRVASPSHVAVEEASLGAKIGALFGAEQKEDGEKALDDEHGGRADAEVVYEALCRHDVLDRVLAIAHTHVEILGQSVETLKFYARMGKLVAAHVEQLWDKRAALHEHDRRTFDHALAALMPSIPRELLERLLHRIAATDLRHFDAPLLDLVVTATELVARVPEAGVADVGLHILWSAVTAPVPLAVSKRATSLLGELLRAPALAPKRERLLDQCLDALTDERVLRLLRRLLEVYVFVSRLHSMFIRLAFRPRRLHNSSPMPKLRKHWSSTSWTRSATFSVKSLKRSSGRAKPALRQTVCAPHSTLFLSAAVIRTRHKSKLASIFLPLCCTVVLRYSSRLTVWSSYGTLLSRRLQTRRASTSFSYGFPINVSMRTAAT